MVNPMDSLNSLQQAVDSKIVKLDACRLFADMRVLFDQPTGKPRFTYVFQDGRNVQAIAMFAMADPYEGEHCFQIGYAVQDSYRQQGLGAKITRQAIVELSEGLKNTPFKRFYIEAVVAKQNTASNKIAEREISNSPVAIKDQFSGEDALQYIKKIDL